jgi:hypothetical protein
MSYSASPSGLTIDQTTGEIDIDASDAGDYTVTFTIANDGYCGSLTKTATVKIRRDIEHPDIRIHLCPVPSRQIHLSSYLDTLNFKNILWSKVSSGSPDFESSTANSTGTLISGKFTSGTHVYRYRVEHECGESKARIFIKSTTGSGLRSLHDTLVVCFDQPMTAYMQLNQIMGLEAGGTWIYATDLAHYISAGNSPQFADARIFDASAAWVALKSNPSYNFTYRGDTYATAFTIAYETSAQSCFGTVRKEIVIVVTANTY